MYRSVLRERLPGVRERIAEAAGRSGRTPDAVRLVVVTKGHPLEALEAVVGEGLADVGENRIEELEAKQAVLGRGFCRWHMIGRLQRRKAPRLAGAVDLVHSVDSLRLAQRLDGAVEAALETGEGSGATRGDPGASDAASEVGPSAASAAQSVAEAARMAAGATRMAAGAARLAVLVQMNTSGEEAKAGLVGPGEELDAILALPHLEVRGLMTMAPWTDDEGVLRGTFRELREISERVRRGGAPLGDELSMGMTNDYTIAIEEGSTMVRIGTALLGERPR